MCNGSCDGGFPSPIHKEDALHRGREKVEDSLEGLTDDAFEMKSSHVGLLGLSTTHLMTELGVSSS